MLFFIVNSLCIVNSYFTTELLTILMKIKTTDQYYLKPEQTSLNENSNQILFYQSSFAYSSSYLTLAKSFCFSGAIEFIILKEF